VLGSPTLTAELQKKLIDGAHAEAGTRSVEELEAERDEILLGLLELRTKRSGTKAEPSDGPVSVLRESPDLFGASPI
jgi:hypothetical protein